MSEEDELTVREVAMDYAGIYYKETGKNKAYINLVQQDGQIKLVLVINQDELGNQFHAMTFGKVLSSISFLEMMQKAKNIEDEELARKEILNGHSED